MSYYSSVRNMRPEYGQLLRLLQYLGLLLAEIPCFFFGGGQSLDIPERFENQDQKPL